MDGSVVSGVRHFNRFYSARMGLYSRDYLGSGLGVTELRVLYEIEHGAEISARAIARKLELNEGYLSRVLARFAKLGWIARVPDLSDRRRKVLALSAEGRALIDRMEVLVAEDTGRRFQGVDVPDILSAMKALEAALTPVDRDTITIRDLEIGDLGWLIARHAELYAETPGLDITFEAFVARILGDFVSERDDATERAFIATAEGRRLGSIFCVAGEAPEVAKLRLLWVEPIARGLGIGLQLIEDCLGFAHESGYRRMELLTLETQVEARALYARVGFELASREAKTAFGREVTEEIWARDL